MPDKDDIMLVANEASTDLARKVAGVLGRPFSEMIRKRFADGECYHAFPGDLAGKKLVIIGTTHDDVSHQELLDLIQGGRYWNAASVNVVIPYLGYSTMERAKPNSNEVPKGVTRTRQIFRARPDFVAFIDLHSEAVLHAHAGEISTFHAWTDSLAAEKLASAVPVLTAGGPVKVRVLLAEDNLVNQKVALVMLRKLGIVADVVGTGVEALDALVGVAYDLVLMDCQMPEMDGFEATRRIRERERGSRRLPVVAMTANAMMGDRERCIEAGMDDHIPKPVRVEALHRALLHWLPAGAVPPLAGEA